MTLSPFEFTVLALAVYRAARIVSTDSISEGLWDRLSEWAEGEGWRQWLHDLVECPWCSGWWLAMFGYVVAVLATGTYSDVGFWEHAIAAFGVAGGASILTALDGKLTE